MTLVPSARLGPYDVTALIGSSGMGEVYRARDTQLNRDVALRTDAEQKAEGRRQTAECL